MTTAFQRTKHSKNCNFKTGREWHEKKDKLGVENHLDAESSFFWSLSESEAEFSSLEASLFVTGCSPSDSSDELISTIFYFFFLKLEKNEFLSLFRSFSSRPRDTRANHNVSWVFGDSSPRNCEMRTKSTRSRTFSVTNGKSGGASRGKMRGSNHFCFSFWPKNWRHRWI